MIKVSILYPYRENGRFDVTYYCESHMPLAAKLFGPGLRSWSVDVGINGGPPDSKPPFFAVGNFVFDTIEAFYEVFKPAAKQLTDDIPTYTDSTAQILITEIKVSV